MGRGEPLSDEERGRIRGLREGGKGGKGVREIARRLGRSTDAVRRVLQGGERQAPTGRPRVLDDRTVRAIVRTAARGEHTARAIADDLALACSVRTVRRVLSDVDWLQYTKMERTLSLSAEHKAACVAWAERMLTLPPPWDRTIFSDEKKWSLDGPDGF